MIQIIKIIWRFKLNMLLHFAWWLHYMTFLHHESLNWNIFPNPYETNMNIENAFLRAVKDFLVLSNN